MSKYKICPVCGTKAFVTGPPVGYCAACGDTRISLAPIETDSVREPISVEQKPAHSHSHALTLVTDRGERIELSDFPVELGREVANSHIVNALQGVETVSRSHAMIDMSKNGAFLLTDLASLNGTCVKRNGRVIAVSEDEEIENGDLLLMGEAVWKVAIK